MKIGKRENRKKLNVEIFCLEIKKEKGRRSFWIGLNGLCFEIGIPL
jgi:hypothetical protein